MQTFTPIAHVDTDDSKVTHSLEGHLAEVSRMAGEMSAAFGAAEWGRIAGQWHDLGKFSSDFQTFIRSTSGFEAHLVDSSPGKVNHSSAGALHAQKEFGDLGLVLAYLIAGHHAGLADWYPDEEGNAALENRLREGNDQGLLHQATEAAPEVLLKAECPAFKDTFGGFQGLHLWIRMLFSCLVDADFLDTEAFMNAEKSGLRGGYPTLASLLPLFDSEMRSKTEKDNPSPVDLLRTEILRQCRGKAKGAPGLYTLTVPTGGGKTLSSLAFALDHAIANDMRRIIYAIPYTSIIEQTADVFRGIFGDAILEHHSNLDSNKETVKSRLAAENWDAPLVVTTNVQLFESLFAARNSRCRKLHNLVNSVIILDEAQLLPPGFLQPILDVMRLLVEHYGVTFVLCTATQPALGTHKDTFGKTQLRGLDSAIEIVAGTDELYRQLERVEVTLPVDLNAQGNWDEIAEEVAQHQSVLAIVNTRSDCRELHRLMPTGTIHLSASMCGEHRSHVIRKIKDELPIKPVRVVSTQLIEAGVDVDFPVVFRALTGLDSIAQAAGRCNREGIQANKGQVYVFVPPKPSPKGLLLFGENACRTILHERPDNLLTPELFKTYFERYYSKVDSLDKNGIRDLLTKNAGDCHIQFRTAAEKFQLIEEDGSAAVIVPYANPSDPSRDSRPLIARLRSGELHRNLLRDLQRFTVSVRNHDFQVLLNAGDIETPSPGIWVLKNETAYHPDLGLLIGDTSNPNPAQLCC
jgi:CRISPR-associated endonuclease/helicase Cas3